MSTKHSNLPIEFMLSESTHPMNRNSLTNIHALKDQSIKFPIIYPNNNEQPPKLGTIVNINANYQIMRSCKDLNSEHNKQESKPSSKMNTAFPL